MIGKFEKIIIVLIVLVFGACSAIVPTEYLITKDQLTNSMQKQFPLHRESGLFSITVDAPQLNLNPGQNRFGMTGHFSAHAAIFEIEGDFAFSSQLKYVPEQRTVYLDGVSLDSLHLKHSNSAPEIVKAEVNRMLNEFATNTPLYQFKPDELVVLGVKVDVDKISVVPDGILLKLRIMH